ncbi:MAG: hypothetical protein KJN64_10380 [Ignavibacteria bacterium]|nr:hypothetical protein [Ignavibacteria bacterium]MBT8383878.1 hypothetical protein [Ignavibacteria bacterium]MBT8390559.1 hypothetical protein [Ignavibacteria bacterium]NNJ51929.1 hypothetical protein [Ignavibacteriaceae bacterium]NNL20419.1 hypothetical protein [Ignavibacteriaceae bacterium]
MKPLICIYCEGNDTKLAVVSKENEGAKPRVLKTASVSLVPSSSEQEADASGFKIEGEALDMEGLEESASIKSDLDTSSITEISTALKDFNLGKHMFIPALTEPAIYYHLYEGARPPKPAKLKQEIINEILDSKNISVEKDSLDFLELSDKALLGVFTVGEVGCVNLVNSLAQHEGKRNYKIPTIKSSDVSLAYYVAKRKKFFPDDHSLIVYIGKEYSKLIFLQGRRLKHIGTTLDIGTQNLHTYDVYFSKILLEMENGGISSLDNIIVCGEDDSENLILSFYGTFPEANVSRLEFDDFDLSALDEETKEKFSAFSIPVAIATDYFDELNKEHSGINILPKRLREEQKVFQFSWHGYAMLPILFAVAFFLTQEILQNNKKMNEMDKEIKEKTILMRQNQEILSKIAAIEGKISSFDQTQAILDSATVGTGIWKDIISQVSSFCGSNNNLWISRMTKGEGNDVVAEGYSLYRNSLTDFAYSIEDAVLKSMLYEELRERSAYKFNLNFNISNRKNQNE